MEWGDRAWGTKQPASSSSKGNTKQVRIDPIIIIFAMLKTYMLYIVY